MLPVIVPIVSLSLPIDIAFLIASSNDVDSKNAFNA